MSLGRLLLVVALAIVGGWLALKLVGVLLGWAVHALVSIAIPVALLVGAVYLVYRLTAPKALGDSRRRFLP